MESNQDQICFPHRWQPVQDAVFGDDRHHEKVDGTAAGLECDLRPTGYFLRWQNAGIAENDPPVKGKCTAAKAAALDKRPVSC